MRLAEYDEDFNLRQRMIAADQRRQRGVGCTPRLSPDNQGGRRFQKVQRVKVHRKYPIDNIPTI